MAQQISGGRRVLWGVLTGAGYGLFLACIFAVLFAFMAYMKALLEGQATLTDLLGSLLFLILTMIMAALVGGVVGIILGSSAKFVLKVSKQTGIVFNSGIADMRMEMHAAHEHDSLRLARLHR